MATEWYLLVGDDEHGPMSPEALRRLAIEGRVTPETLVKKGAAGFWVSAGSVKGLFATAPNRQAPLRPQPASAASGHLDQTHDSNGGGVPGWIWGLAALAVIFLCTLGVHTLGRSNQGTEIETANQEVQRAVEKARDWIRDGRLSDADQVEQSLKAAGANPIATEKGQVGPTLTALQKAQRDRWAAEVLKAAIEAIFQKQFGKAQTFLQQYLDRQWGTERQKAQTLLAEIDLATSDDDALRTLVAMDDNSFNSFSKGNVSAVVLSHPVLTELRIASLRKKLAEAGRERDEIRKRVEAERVAEQKQHEAKQVAEQKRRDADRLDQLNAPKFRKAVLAFIEESETACRLYETGPSIAAYRARSDAAAEAFARIPPPSGGAKRELYEGIKKDVDKLRFIGAFLEHYYEDMAEISPTGATTDYEKNMEKIARDCLEAGQKSALEELQRMSELRSILGGD